MILNTSNFGVLEVNEKDIIQFPHGIPGFEKMRKFTLIKHEENSPFSFLQSVEEEELVFVVVEPLAFFPQYKVMLSKQNLADIKIEKIEDSLIRLIVTIPQNPQQMTANLQAPLIINTKDNLAKQIILDHADYKTKHFLFQCPTTSEDSLQKNDCLIDKG